MCQVYKYDDSFVETFTTPYFCQYSRKRTPLTMKMFVVALAVACFVAIGEMNHPCEPFGSLVLLILISLGLNSSFSLFSSSILLLLLPLYLLFTDMIYVTGHCFRIVFCLLIFFVSVCFFYSFFLLSFLFFRVFCCVFF